MAGGPSLPELRKFLAPEIVTGVGARHLAGHYARIFGARRVLLVTDPGVLAAGWAADVLRSLETEGLEVRVFSGVTSNPRTEEVMAGAEAYQGSDALVSVGGGSPTDCAKGIGIVVSNRAHIATFEGVDEVRLAMPPLICVPTTGGTSADLSQFAIFSDLARRTKFAVISKTVVPDVSLLDPETLTSLPADLTVWTGLDALVHAVEAFVSTGASSMTDLHALEAVRIITTSLRDCVERPKDVEARGRVMQASMHAGLAFSNASLGGVHALAHSVGGWLDLPHGETNALLLEHVLAFNFERAPERYVRIGEAMGLDFRGLGTSQRKRALLEAVQRLRRELGVASSLGPRGLHRTDVPEVARNALQDPCMVTNPRRPTPRDVEVLYEEAL